MRRRLLRLLRPGPERAADLEIRHHIGERTERLIEEGWDPAEARAEAERRFGDADAYRDELARMGRSEWRRTTMRNRMDQTWSDLRYAVRGISRRRTFTWSLVATLALGIGAAAAIFSVVDAVMLRPLPYERPDELVTAGLRLQNGTALPFLTAEQVDPWLRAADFLGESAYHERVTLTRTDGPEPRIVALEAVSHGLDDVLGMTPRMGRSFGPDDAVPGRDRVILLSHGYWRGMGAPPDVVGSEIRLEEEPWTVVGVLPPDFKYPVAGALDGWIPLASDRTAAGRPIGRMEVVGRLAGGITLEAAQERADAIAGPLQEEAPASLGWTVRLQRLDAWRGNRDARRGLWLLAGAVGLMLLIALGNSANLLLVRTSVRRRELGVRRAIGASRGRILRQLLTESVVLSVVAGVLAVAVGAGLVEGLRATLPAGIGWSSVFELGLEGRSLLFVFAVAAGSGVLVGLLPALHGARRPPSGTRVEMTSEGPGRWLRHLIVGSEVALSVALLGGAGLFLHSFARILAVDPGFDVDRIAQVEVPLSERVYPTGADRRRVLDRMVAEIEGLPEVEGVTLAGGLPPDGGTLSFGEGFQGEGREPLEGFRILPHAAVEPDYARTLGLRIVEGRFLQPGDEAVDGWVVDRDLARDLFGEGPAVGRRFRTSEEGDWHSVVGVVDELTFGGLDDSTSPWAALRAAPRETWSEYASLGVRTVGDPAEALVPIREAIRRVDPIQPVYDLSTARDALAGSVDGPRFLTLVMATLAGVAAVLAALGVYGVLSYTVSQRRREMGIRIALGAPLGGVRRTILRTGLLPAGLGAAGGVTLVLLLSGIAEELLFGVTPGDPLSLIAGTTLMLGAALLACWIPARRASRIDPVAALRAEP